MNSAQRTQRVARSLMVAIAIATVGPLFGQIMPALSATPTREWFSPLKQDAPPPPPPYDTIAGGGQVWNVWRSIFDSDPPFDTRDGGNRGEGFCRIAPVETEGALVVGDRPTFIWRGNAERVEIELADGSISSIPLPSEPDSTLHIYTNDRLLLQPGEVYRWRIQPQGLAFSPWLYAEVVDAETQASVRAALHQIEMEMSGEAEEAIALAKADYLAAQQLWTDFWREILSVESPSATLTGAIQELTQNLCDPLPADSTTDP